MAKIYPLILPIVIIGAVLTNAMIDRILNCEEEIERDEDETM